MLRYIFIKFLHSFMSFFWRIKYRGLFFAKKISINGNNITISNKSRIYGNIIAKDNANLFIDENVNVDKYSIIEVVGSEAKIKLCAGVIIGPYSCIGTEFNIEINTGTTTSRFFNCVGDVVIGKNVLIGPNVFISSGKHIIKNKNHIRSEDALYLKEHGKPFSARIEIGDNSWIGANTVILPGVTLGNGCVVGANSVVTKSFPEDVIIGGVPAKILKLR